MSSFPANKMLEPLVPLEQERNKLFLFMQLKKVTLPNSEDKKKKPQPEFR